MIKQGDTTKLYTGLKELEMIDPETYKTTDDLMNKIRNATNILKRYQTKAAGFYYDDVNDDDEDKDEKNIDTLF